MENPGIPSEPPQRERTAWEGDGIEWSVGVIGWLLTPIVVAIALRFG